MPLFCIDTLIGQSESKQAISASKIPVKRDSNVGADHGLLIRRIALKNRLNHELKKVFTVILIHQKR